MKKGLVLLVFVSLLGGLCGRVCAQQQGVRHFENGDYVTVSFLENNNGTLYRYYMSASNNGLGISDVATDDCLWEIRVPDQSDTADIMLKDVSTGYYLQIDLEDDNNPWGKVYTVLTNNENVATRFRFYEQEDTIYRKSWEEGKYRYGRLYCKQTWQYGVVNMYVGNTWNGGMSFGANTWTETSIYLEKWEKKGDPVGYFAPSKIEFTYDKEKTAGVPQSPAKQEVQFYFPTEVASYWECINRPDEIKLKRENTAVDFSGVEPTIYWASNGESVSWINRTDFVNEPDDREVLEIVNKGNAAFTVQTVGDIVWDLKWNGYGTDQWVDYADNVVAEYEYNGKTYTSSMRVVRKSYHKEEMPPLVFSINPVTYTFAKEKETKPFAITISHQHGEVIYNMDHQAIRTNYEEGPDIIPLNDQNWTLSWNTPIPNWLSIGNVTERNVAVTTEANGTGTKRSYVLEGTFRRKTDDASGHEHSGTFEIPVHQRGVEGGIKFKTQAGKGASAEDLKAFEVTGRQNVHTAERTIYYEAGQEIELRLPESGFSGYMRWYDYDTNGDPYYNGARGKASTSWVLSPRAANGSPFSAINTPQSANTVGQEGYSYGLYAVNKADKGVLDEDNLSNPAPILKGWTDGEAHTMACDVSAYTDYTIWYNETNTTRIDSIEEPTLSYRQLFHLKPASEMAKKFADLEDGKYLEEYKYMAPAGKQVLLATEFRYKKYRSHESEMCYFYHGTDGKVHRITASTPVVWKEDDQVISSPNYTAEMDYLIVRSNTPTTPNKKVYTLTLPAGAAGNEKELRIAKFEVEYVSVNACGPTTTTLISQQRIQSSYKSLATVSFDSQSNHLPWGESSYGYVYSTGELATKYKRGANQGVFPFYGEYTVTDRVDKDWARQSAHSDSALYVDGTMEPGLVASIYTDAVICSGQTLACSAWFCNPTPSGWNSEGNPIFRCNVQGRHDDNSPWEDVSVYFVGELLKASGWQQVVFPIQSDANYAQTRVSIYNFATTNLGNDFMVDDICLFASPLPLAAYQGEMACRTSGESETLAAAVLRLDYSNMDMKGDTYVYYQIYNETAKGDVDLDKAEGVAYYHDAHQGGDHAAGSHYGSISIPNAAYVPTGNDLVYQSVSRMLDEMAAKGTRNAKAYIRTENSGVTKYLLYVAHMLKNTDNQANRFTQLYANDDYSMRMAFDHDELEVAECNMTTPLHATKETLFELMSSNGETQDGIKTTNTPLCCPNKQYTLYAKIKNHFALGVGELANDYEAKVCVDWLVGSAFDDPYTTGRPSGSAKEQIDAQFVAKYGYTRGQIATAILYDMRRVPTSDSPNDNYTAKSVNELNVSHFLSRQNYDIVRHLCDKGYLEMYKTEETFYLGDNDAVRYWAFPIAETAKTTVELDGNNTVVTLQDCVEPKWVKIVSGSSDGYYLNIAPIKWSDMTVEQKATLPTYKVLKKNVGQALTLKATEVGDTITVAGTTITAAGQTISLTLPADAGQNGNVKVVDMETGNEVGRAALEAGKEYRVTFSFKDRNDGSFGECGEGEVAFLLAVVPDVLVWTPSASSYNGWGKDENWRGWVDSNGNQKIDSGELVKGYVPMTGADVIIPTQSNAVRYPHIIDEHSHYPMTINYEAHNCSNIYFGPGAHFQNQHLLQYEKAYVDMVVPATKWNLMASPLKDMYTGDFFVPHSGTYDKGGSSLETSEYFNVGNFQGTRAWDAAYAFWLSFYNQDVSVRNQSGSSEQSATTAEFVPSNSLVQKVAVGGGVSVLGYGPGDKEVDLVVRLPKSDTQYRYYSPEGQPTNTINVPTRANSNKLAYEPSNDVMRITLTNKVASNKYVFGNPTMSNIDMNLFLADNKDVLTGNYYTLESSSWDAQTEVKGGRYLAPMRAVLLEAKSSGTSLPVSLKPSHTTLDNQVKRNVAPARISGRQEVGAADDWVDGVAKAEVMTIMGLVDDVCARVSIAVDPNADNAYYKGEDALFISSGVEAGVGTDVATSPVNMYTVANGVPMMMDVRSEVSRVPLKVLVDTINYRSETMMLMFKLTSNWQKVCYFCDAVTGQKIRIYDEMVLQVERPRNHAERYYLEGPDPYNEGGDVTTSTTHPIEDNGANGVQMYVYPEGNGKLLVTSDGLIQSVVVYDMLGRVVASQEQELLNHEVRLNAPVGVCVVETVMQNGSRQRARVIVK